MSVKSAYESIANEYDSKYENSLFWRVSDDITVSHMNNWLPQRGKAIDIGCGTGDYGLRLLEKGYDVDFSDLSHEMLSIVAKKIKNMKLKYSPKLLEMDLCTTEFELPEMYDVMIAEGDVLGYCLDEAPHIIRKLEQFLSRDGVMFIGLDNMIINVIEMARCNGIDGIENFFKSGKTTCPMSLPIKQYSITSFEKIIPDSLYIAEVIGKPIITPYLSMENQDEIMKNTMKYEQLIKLEEQAICNEYSALGSHFTFVLKRNEMRK